MVPFYSSKGGKKGLFLLTCSAYLFVNFTLSQSNSQCSLIVLPEKVERLEKLNRPFFGPRLAHLT